MALKLYTYLDGNGNKYVIKIENKKIIEYIPIKPKFSSSGVYDGGNYIEKEISNLEFDEITFAINEAIRNTQNHIKHRVKMSGMIIIQDKEEEKTYILRPNSKELIKIEEKLHNIIKN